jgi:hypothetical protein
MNPMSLYLILAPLRTVKICLNTQLLNLNQGLSTIPCLADSKLVKQSL